MLMKGILGICISTVLLGERNQDGILLKLKSKIAELMFIIISVVNFY
jgi:hypothetical protein